MFPNLIVQKFGGSSVAKPEQIVAIARKIAELHRAGKQIIAVVSAMGKTTDELIGLAQQVSDHPDRRELDMLLSTGERVSMALMSMALRDLKCPSISFTGSQAGVFTDHSHANAKIIDMKPIRVTEALQKKQVVVLAGFQGVDPITKEITTLGRGGSDTTAVAMAAHFRAQRCEILKDVDGVFSADPKLLPAAKLYPRMPLPMLNEMCFWGAKVLHCRSVELALREGVPLSIGRAENFVIGTEIVPDKNGELKMFEQQRVIAVNSHAEVHHLHIASTETAEAMNTLQHILKEEKMAWPQILASAFENGTTRVMYTTDSESLSALRRVMSNSSKVKVQEKVLASVTATCYGSISSSLAQEISGQLSQAGIAIDKMIMSPLSISFFVPQASREKAVKVIHQLIKT